MKKIAVITNYNIFEKSKIALRAAQTLSDLGGEVVFPINYKEKILRAGKKRYDCNFLSPEEIYEQSDIILVLGGDGSILDAARHAAPKGKPLLGINMGHLGYMTELEPGELPLLSRLFTEEYTLDERAMLDVKILSTDGAVRAESFALNDAVISNGSVARIVDLELFEGKESVSSYRADGMIIATPTGSTAYSLSAGGALTDPHLCCICVTPICPHSLTARPVIFRDDAVLEVKNICRREKMLYLTLDGRNSFELYRGERVRVTRSDMKTSLIRLRKGGFYEKLKKKMKSFE